MYLLKDWLDIDIVHGGRGWDEKGVSGDADDREKSERNDDRPTNGARCSPLTRS
jgi:hypothetical protein